MKHPIGYTKYSGKNSIKPKMPKLATTTKPMVDKKSKAQPLVKTNGTPNAIGR